jgi:hypothetical protein
MVGITGAGVSKGVSMENNFFACNSQLPLSGPSLSQQPPAITGIASKETYWQPSLCWRLCSAAQWQVRGKGIRCLVRRYSG